MPGRDLSNNDQAAEECSRHFAISLGAGKVVEITADQWNRGRPFAAPSGIWYGNPRAYSEIEPLVRRIAASVTERSPFAASVSPERRNLSPDRRFVVLSTIAGPAVAKGIDYEGHSEILVDVHDGASGKRVASLRGQFLRVDPGPLLNGGTWISDRHLILPALVDNSELTLCDLSRESDAADPVMPVAEQPMLFAFDTGSDESWTHAGNTFPGLTALALVPAAEWWNLQWRATNPAGKSHVMLTPGSMPGGFLWFQTPIPGNELRDGPYQIDAFAFLELHSNRRVALTAAGFLTPVYQYPRPDYAAMQASWDRFDRMQRRRPSRVPTEKPQMGMELEFAGSVKEGAATVYTVDCLTKERPVPTEGFATTWELQGAELVVKPDVGLCVKGATKLYFTPPPNPPPGDYEIKIEALAGNWSWSTSQSFVVDDPARAAEAKPRQMVPIQVASPSTTPIPLAVVPYWGRGMKQRFSFVAVKAGPEIAAMEVRIAFASKGDEPCSFRFDRVGTGVTLKSESGHQASVMENAYCRVSAPEIQVEGDSVRVSASVEFKPAFGGREAFSCRL